MNHASLDSKVRLMLSLTLLCLCKSKPAFKVTFRCHLFSGSIFSFPLQNDPSKKSPTFSRFLEVCVQPPPPPPAYSPSFFRVLSLQTPLCTWPWTHSLTFWFTVLPHIFSFLYLCPRSCLCQIGLALFGARKMLPCPSRGTSNIIFCVEPSLTSPRWGTLPRVLWV